MVLNSTNVTLIFIIDKKNNRILLIHKKRGFGVGKYNGIGGKVEENETVKEAALRELKEEVNVEVSSIEKKAVLFFKNKNKDFFESMLCHVFVSYDSNVDPVETEEARPEWFSLDEIPFDKMWEDDIYWLPYVLDDFFVYGEFYFENWLLKKHFVKKIKEKQ